MQQKKNVAKVGSNCTVVYASTKVCTLTLFLFEINRLLSFSEVPSVNLT